MSRNLDLRNPATIRAEEATRSLKVDVAVAGYALLVFFAVALAIAPTVAAKARYDAALSKSYGPEAFAVVSEAKQ